jgi:predicted HicB family RNase H-like nuclease
MDAKLTVKLDSEIVKKAKVYAKERNTSLTKLIESYLALLTTPANTT